MYELVALSLLMRRPVTGYLIAGVIDDVVGPIAKASHGRIYPLLTKLTDDGLVEVVDQAETVGGRVSRTFAITDAGRERFRSLMLDTRSSPKDYREVFAFKASALDLIERGDRVVLLDHYIDFARAHVRHLVGQAEDLARSDSYGSGPEHGRRLSAVFAHLKSGWEAELRWVEGLRADEG
jgi:DNA-binding PadR family transcriptional regulator